MNHTSKTKQCLVVLKWTILVTQKLILLLLMWPFPQPQFKPARKGEVRRRIQEQPQKTLRLNSDKHGVGRRQKRPRLLSPEQVPTGGCGAGRCSYLHQTPHQTLQTKHRWETLWRKRQKGLQTAAEVTQEKAPEKGEKKKKKLLWKRAPYRKRTR